MMNKVFRNELEEGMRFTAPVFFDDGENMLVSKGVAIKSRELAALDRWNISFVLTAGKPVTDDSQLAPAEEEFAELDEVEELDEE
ncbi:MAG TPA: metal-dependent phosphohydrolase, partial [Treponemataceae bacterium]|nr:metal-dependent phosphohydrolase [Treponemataceae bacterium]